MIINCRLTKLYLGEPLLRCIHLGKIPEIKELYLQSLALP